MRAILKAFAGLTLALAWVGAISLGGAVSDREPPIVYEKAQALTSSVPQGGTIEVEFQVFRQRICPAEVKRWLLDSHGVKHAIPSFTVGLEFLVGRERYRRSFTVPEAAATGPASYYVVLEYRCNWLHRLGWPIELVSPSVHFDITPRPILILPPLASPTGDDG